VTGLTLAVCLQLSVFSAEAETYAQAHKEMSQTGKPMVVMVGTDWCGPCRKMKQVVLPEVRKRGLLKQVAFALVNADHDSKLAAKLIGNGPIPQLVMFRRTANGWRRQKLVGGQEVEKVEKFLREGIATSESDQLAEPPAVRPGNESAGVKVVPVSGR
jgi:thioredoxin-like negative regulator of GroEL